MSPETITVTAELEEELLDTQGLARRAQFALNITKYMVWIAAIVAVTSAEWVTSDWTRRWICMNDDRGW